MRTKLSPKMRQPLHQSLDYSSGERSRNKNFIRTDLNYTTVDAGNYRNISIDSREAYRSRPKKFSPDSNFRLGTKWINK